MEQVTRAIDFNQGNPARSRDGTAVAPDRRAEDIEYQAILLIQFGSD